jgi:hypothetical protein
LTVVVVHTGSEINKQRKKDSAARKKVAIAEFQVEEK